MWQFVEQAAIDFSIYMFSLILIRLSNVPVYNDWFDKITKKDDKKDFTNFYSTKQFIYAMLSCNFSPYTNGIAARTSWNGPREFNILLNIKTNWTQELPARVLCCRTQSANLPKQIFTIYDHNIFFYFYMCALIRICCVCVYLHQILLQKSRRRTVDVLSVW